MRHLDRSSIALLAAALVAGHARADKLSVRDAKGERTLVGNVLKTDSTGAVLFETRDGQQLVFTSEQIDQIEKSEAPVQLYTRPELKAALIEEFGKDFH